METNNGERIYIDYLNMNYENFDIYQKSHFKRYIYAKDLIKNKIEKKKKRRKLTSKDPRIRQ